MSLALDNALNPDLCVLSGLHDVQSAVEGLVHHPPCQVRCALQLHDDDGPTILPDFYGVICDWDIPNRAALFNLCLLSSNSVRYGGGHYAGGYHCPAREVTLYVLCFIFLKFEGK